MLWFQFMLGWMANQPADALWFLPRVAGGWRTVAWAIFLVQFAGPLFLLLFRWVKSNPRILGRVAAVILLMQLVFVYYLVIPPFRAPSLLEHWMDFLTPIGLAASGWAVSWTVSADGAVLAPNDPNRESALHLRHLDEEDIERERPALPARARRKRHAGEPRAPSRRRPAGEQERAALVDPLRDAGCSLSIRVDRRRCHRLGWNDDLQPGLFVLSGRHGAASPLAGNRSFRWRSIRPTNCRQSPGWNRSTVSPELHARMST